MSSHSSTAGGLVGQRLGKHEVLALLALGGTAEIYLARIAGVAGFQKHVVVKVLHDHLADDQEFVRMFRDEARLGAQLTHSNIVQTLELGEHQGRYFMVMEYLAGMSMAILARKAAERVPGGVLPVELTLGLMVQACSGLHYSHKRKDSSGRPMNIVHRDVSPQNLVVTFDGNLKVVDYGIAKAAVRETQTQSGTIKGKFAYMSPEQCVAGDVDLRTDVFALGIVVHELLTGRRLFKRDSAYDTYHAILECKVPRLTQVNRQLDPELDSIVLKALSYEAKDRYDTAEQFGDALQGFLHRRGIVVNAATVTRFFDQYFDQEIREHGERMRALMQGRKAAPLSWDDDDGGGGGDAEANPPPSGPRGGQATAAMPSQSPMNAASSGFISSSNERSEILDASMLEEIVEDDEEEGDGATQIENNPLERIRDLALQQAAQARAGTKQELPKARNAGMVANAQQRTVAFSAASANMASGMGAPPSGARPGPASAAKTLIPGDLHAQGADDDVDEDAATLIADGSLNVDKLLADAKAAFAEQQKQMAASGPTPSPAGSGPTPGPGMGSHPSLRPPPGSGPTPQPGMGQQHGMGQHGMGQMGQNAYGQAPAYGPGAGQGYPPQRVAYGTGPTPGSAGPYNQSQQQPAAEGKPAWLLAVVFLVCAGIGFGATVLVSKLL